MEFKQGDWVRIERNGTVYEGKVMPSMEGYITIKMKSGYNAGFSIDKVRITLMENNGETANGGRNGVKECKTSRRKKNRAREKAPKSRNPFYRRNDCQQNRLSDRRSHISVYC